VCSSDLQTIGQIRENAKFLSGQKTELEKFYKTLRKDLGYNEIEPESTKTVDGDDNVSDDGEITDNRKLNEMIKNAMLSKDNDKKKD
jgi:hypothetical protein